MTLNDILNITLAIINSLVFIVMLIALLYQRTAIKHNQKSIINSQKELQTSLIATRIQVFSILLSQKNNELERIDISSNLESQEKYTKVSNEINYFKHQLELLTNKLSEV